MCHAHQHRLTTTLPVVEKRTPPQLREWVGLLALNAAGTEVLLQRSTSGLFAGLWNLPMREGRDRKAAQGLLTALNARGSLTREPHATLEHVLTHRRLQIQLYRVTVDTITTQLDLRLQPRNQLCELGMSSLTRKALATLRQPQKLSLPE